MPRATITFKPILPKGKFDVEIYRDAYEAGMRQFVKPEITKLFKDTVGGWESKPVFRGTINKTSHFLRLLVKPVGRNAPLYAMIDITGAKEHPITPTRAPELVYRRGYRSATTPRVLRSRRKQRFGPVERKTFVWHPGFEPREFSESIAQEYKDRFFYHMDNATRYATEQMNKRMSAGQ